MQLGIAAADDDDDEQHACPKENGHGMHTGQTSVHSGHRRPKDSLRMSSGCLRGAGIGRSSHGCLKAWGSCQSVTRSHAVQSKCSMLGSNARQAAAPRVDTRSQKAMLRNLSDVRRRSACKPAAWRAVNCWAYRPYMETNELLDCV
jgi:hypothetical protein